jgi:hypothetical protein
MYAWLAEQYLVMSWCDMMNLVKKIMMKTEQNCLKLKKKNLWIILHLRHKTYFPQKYFDYLNKR